jgi:hypothetical protein
MHAIWTPESARIGNIRSAWVSPEMGILCDPPLDRSEDRSRVGIEQDCTIPAETQMGQNSSTPL